MINPRQSGETWVVWGHDVEPVFEVSWITSTNEKLFSFVYAQLKVGAFEKDFLFCQGDAYT